MAIRRENTPDGVKLRDTRTGKLAGSVPKKAEAPKPVELPDNVEDSLMVDFVEDDTWERWERHQQERELARLREAPPADWQSKVEEGFVDYFEKRAAFRNFKPNDPQVTKDLNVYIRDALDSFLKLYHGKLVDGVDEREAKDWYNLQRAKMDFLQHWRYGPLLDCTVKWVDGEPEYDWQSGRAVSEVKEVLSVVFDDSVGYGELSEARLKFRLCPGGGWHRSNECHIENSHQEGKVYRGLLPDVPEYSRINKWEYGLSYMYYHEDS